MAISLLSLLALAAAGTSALLIPDVTSPAGESSALASRSTSHWTRRCAHTDTARHCWGEYNINTNYYDTIFHTGRTAEFWLNIEEIDCAPDGYKRKCITANGTMPGPAITANWGDEIVVHVTNNMAVNGTAIHFHGIRMLNNTQYDGVPGVSQCPVAPGSSMTYKFHASQYGTSLYHSHFTLQYSMGLYGPLIINGPATANYNEDLGSVFLTDWDHKTIFDIWSTTANYGIVSVGTGLVNGMNTGNCPATNATAQDPNCIDGGEKFQLTFEPGKKYRLRIINIATEGWFQFSIDGHNFTVIQTDFVPIVPYTTDSVLINMAQRYDIIVEANATPGDYWMRGGFITTCAPNPLADNMSGIIRYDKTSTEIPTSVSNVVPITHCNDEPAANLVPWVPVNLRNIDGGIIDMDVVGGFYQNKYLRWTFNGSFMWTNWSNPALEDVISGNLADIPVSDNLFQVGLGAPNFTSDSSSCDQSRYRYCSDTDWVVLVIDDETPVTGISHPIHLHGHDVLVLAASNEHWNGSTDGWQVRNPPRRDVAILPANGHLVIAWALDNPGIWIMHCHNAWHSSQGFGATLLESPALIAGTGGTSDWDEHFAPMCDAWKTWEHNAPYEQDDSGV